MPPAHPVLSYLLSATSQHQTLVDSEKAISLLLLIEQDVAVAGFDHLVQIDDSAHSSELVLLSLFIVP